MKLQITRKWIQLLSALIYNANLTGFANGTIFQGASKGVCVPGLNCYSCPGAIAACPIGSLQNAISAIPNKLPLYVLGTLLLFGVLFGRLICGFLCPFGLLQELLHKIPTPKIRKSKLTRRLTILKYVILIVFVVLLPLVTLSPAFCKFICPAGTLEAGIPLVAANPSLRDITGDLFVFKMTILVIITVSVLFLYRAFCRFICPLGAIYSLFRKVTILRIVVDQSLCNGCNACTRTCQMDVQAVGDRECIQCGECIAKCPQNAIHLNVRRKKECTKKESSLSSS